VAQTYSPPRGTGSQDGPPVGPPTQPPAAPPPTGGNRRGPRLLPQSPGAWVKAIAALAAFAILIASGITWVAYKHLTSSIARGAPVPALAPGMTDPDGAAQNILLIGNDSRAGATKSELKALSTGSVDTMSTDTMILLHMPVNGGKPSLISFPRDSWVSIPGHGKGKLNAAYADGYTTAKDAGKSETAAQGAGIVLTIKTLEQLTGLYIDHYMQVNLLGFYRISNAIGGVTVCLNAKQNAKTDSDAFGSGYSGINLPKGVSVIKGKQALAFVRQRHGLPNGDLDRIKRQQYFLASAFEKITSAGTLLNPFKLHNLLVAVGSSMLADPTLNPLKMARQFQDLASGALSATTIPNNGPQLIYPDGVETSIVAVDTAAMPDFIRRLIGKQDSALKTAPAAAPSTVTVDVLNGTTITKWATTNAAVLKKDGFHIDVVDSAQSPATSTQILYRSGEESAAKALAQRVAGAELVLSNDVKHTTLILGSDGKKVRGAVLAATNSGALGTNSPVSSPAMRLTAFDTSTTPGKPGVPKLGCIN
jgi:LCP family protein required for cell wall assembly